MFIGQDIIITVHIDDLLVFAKNTTIIDQLRQKIEQKVVLTNLGEAKYYLDIEIIRNRDKNTITLTQRNFVK